MKAGALLQIISADISSVLQTLTREQITVYAMEAESEIELRVWVSERDLKKTKRLLNKSGAEFVMLKNRGLSFILKKVGKRFVLLAVIMMLLFLTIFLPSKILFVEIIGNETVSDTRILEAAKNVGLYFGADRQSIRSEKMKNFLLEQIPELSWVGVNTAGCLATISVHESDTEEKTEDASVSHIIAVRDGIIESCVVTRGRILCKVGDAVKKGQILVSGYADHSFLITATRSSGEIIGRTARKIEAVMLLSGIHRLKETRKATNTFLVLSNRVYPLVMQMKESDPLLNCLKTIKITQFVLPGNMKLPVWVREETYYFFETSPKLITEEEAAANLKSYSNEYVRAQMIGGSIRSCSFQFHIFDDILSYTADMECLELIGQEMPAEQWLNPKK